MVIEINNLNIQAIRLFHNEAARWFKYTKLPCYFVSVIEPTNTLKVFVIRKFISLVFVVQKT